jgi:hypothetical protein
MGQPSIPELDRLLQAVQLVMHSEKAIARGCSGDLAARVDPDGLKLAGFCLGILDSVRAARRWNRALTDLLVYMLLLCEQNPGCAAPTAERLLSRDVDQTLRRYISAGQAALSEIIGDTGKSSGRYARLLKEDWAKIGKKPGVLHG